MLTIYAALGARYSACHYYRVVMPFRAMQAQGLPIQLYVDRPETGHSLDERTNRFFGADIAFMYQPMSKDLGYYVDMLDDFKPSRNSKGEWQWPPSLVIDTDDDLFNVSPLNTAPFRGFGTRLNGETIPPGKQIIHQKAYGDPKVIEQEGVTFQLAQNLERCAEFRSILNRADLVTCTTPYAAEYVQRETRVKDVFVSPNAIMIEDFVKHPGVTIRRKDPDEIRVLWQGGDSHYEDLLPLRDQMVRLAHTHPNIKWVFWGALYDWLVQDMPADRVEWHQWVDHRAYHLKLSTLDIDIAIAPLSDTLFNRSRSAIKWYEPSVMGAATVAQRFGPYELEIEDGLNGLLFSTPEEFGAAIEKLIVAPTLRKQMAANARNWVLTNRDARVVAKRLYDKFVDIRERKKREQPPEEDPKPTEGQEDAVHREHADSR